MNWLTKILAAAVALLWGALLIVRRQLGKSQVAGRIAKDAVETEAMRSEVANLEEKVALDDQVTEKALHDYDAYRAGQSGAGNGTRGEH